VVGKLEVTPGRCDPIRVDRVNEGAGLNAGLLDPLTAPVKPSRLLFGPQASGSEHKRSHSEAPDGIDLGRPVAKPAILAQRGDVLPATKLEPLDVAYLLIAIAEDLVMRSDDPAPLTQGPRHRVPTQAAVHEELKQLLGA
jgi:hypothetical protein